MLQNFIGEAFFHFIYSSYSSLHSIPFHTNMKLNSKYVNIFMINVIFLNLKNTLLLVLSAEKMLAFRKAIMLIKNLSLTLRRTGFHPLKTELQSSHYNLT